MLRLRQICLVAPALARAVEQLTTLFELDVCHRDPAVATYGLENALFVFGHQFLEIVAPLREGTAAGRFLQQSGGRGAYMAIFDCDDLERRRAHLEALGVRIASAYEAPGYCGIQLHPRDARATMIDLNQSADNERLDGAYGPAGASWRRAQRLDRVRGIARVEVETHAPAELAAHWGELLSRPVTACEGAPSLAFDLGSARFVASEGPERLTRVYVDAPNGDALAARAAALGLPSDERGFRFCGVEFVLRDDAPSSRS